LAASCRLQLTYFGKEDLRIPYSEKKSAFRASLALLHNGRFPAEKFITRTLPLERIHEAFPLMESGEALKVCILPS